MQSIPSRHSSHLGANINGESIVHLLADVPACERMKVACGVSAIAPTTFRLPGELPVYCTIVVMGFCSNGRDRELMTSSQRRTLVNVELP